LSERAIERTLDILNEYYRDIRNCEVEDVHVLGTEALRLARNQDEFRDTLFSQFNWNLTTLTGEEEAYYSYLGAIKNMVAEEHDALVIDVGGGSTEIISGLGNSVHFMQSIPIGVVKIGEMLDMKIRLSQKDCTTIKNMIFDQIKELPLPHDTQVIGSGGTMTTLAAIREQMYIYNPQVINGYTLELSELADLYLMLNELNLDQRRRLPGLIPGREDVILYGTLVFMAIMEQYNYNKIIASDRGLRYGWFYKIEMNEAN
jgi:exopolyphosphatase/guanosine-5'-triphosphate,3'-diphosphate pyrophosphatase